MRSEFVAGAIGQGLNSFMDSYLDAKRENRRQAEADDDRKLRRRQIEASDYDSGRVWDESTGAYKPNEGTGFLSRAKQKQMSGLLEVQKASGENWYRKEYAPYRTALERLMSESFGQGATGELRGPDTASPTAASAPLPGTGPRLMPRQKQIAQTEALGNVPPASVPVAQSQVPSAEPTPFLLLKKKIASRSAPGYNKADWAPGFVPKAQKEQLEQNQKDLFNLEMDEAKREAEGPKQNQAQAASFASSAKKAEDAFNELTAAGFNRADAKYSAYADVSRVPYLGGMLASLTPKDLAKQNAAERMFLNSIMRRDSGATIPPAEMAEGAKLYFPRPGDDAETLKLKQRNRIGRRAALEEEAGPRLMKKLSEREAAMGAAGTSPTVKPDFSKMSVEELKAYTGAE